MKQTLFCTAFGLISSFIATAFGGWDASIATLLIFMGVDYITGMICAFCGKSAKTENGGASSAVGLIGLAKKVFILLLIIVAVRLDMLVGTTYIRDAVCLTFCLNELLSIVENAGLIGLPIPKALTAGIDALKDKASEITRKDDEKHGK